MAIAPMVLVYIFRSKMDYFRRHERFAPMKENTTIQRDQWWRDQVVYQIYPRSLRIPTVMALGICANYQSRRPPGRTWGRGCLAITSTAHPRMTTIYDISITKISTPCSALSEDFDELLEALHEQADIKLVMDPLLTTLLMSMSGLKESASSRAILPSVTGTSGAIRHPMEASRITGRPHSQAPHGSSMRGRSSTICTCFP